MLDKGYVSMYMLDKGYVYVHYQIELCDLITMMQFIINMYALGIDRNFG